MKIIILSTIMTVIVYFLGYIYKEDDTRTNFIKRISIIFLIMLCLNSLAPLAENMYYYFLVTLLMIFSIIDIRFKLVPTRYVISFLVITLYFYHDNLINRFIYLAIMFGFMLLLGIVVSKATKKEALGGGDIQLYGIIGYLLNPVMSFISLFIASVVGLIYLKFSKVKEEFPFVPFISIGVVLVYLFYSDIYTYFIWW